MTFQHSRLFSFGLCWLFILTLFVANSNVLAQGVSTPLFTIHNVSPGPVVFIGNSASPIPVDLDPLGPPWQKSIGDPNNNVVGVATIDIIETLVNVGTEAWTDWHEFMLPPPVGLTPPVWTNVVGLTVNGNPISFTATGLGSGNLDMFNFSQVVMPGDIFGIHKQALVDGSIVANGAFLRIHEYPTVPEPACLALLAIGGLMASGMRRRRQATIASVSGR
jgi:hypothetical protein